MRAKRQRHSDLFKAKVALAALKGDRTVAQLAAAFDLHATQVSQWKKQLLANASAAFGSDREGSEVDHDAREALLYQQIGKLQMELDWLKKKVAQLG
jgi:transposase-like protein